MARYLKAGGRLLILDSVLNTRSTMPFIAASFGMSVENSLMPLEAPDGRPMVPALTGLPGPPGPAATRTWRHVTRGGGVALWRNVGAGRLMVVFDAALFSDRSFGGVYTTPDGAQVDVYEAQREVLELLMQGEPGSSS